MANQLFAAARDALFHDEIVDLSSPLPSADDPSSPRGKSDGSTASMGDGASARAKSDGQQLSLSSVATRSQRRLARGVSAVPERQGDSGVLERRCEWCERKLAPTALVFCSKKCRQTAFRARQLAVVEDAWDEPKRLSVADPPYVGLSKKYYGKEPTYAGEVDHPALIASLMEQFDGWALACSMASLRELLPLCPPEARVCTWSKPHGASPHTRGIHCVTEAVIVLPARSRKPGVRDHLEAHPARGGGTLMGRKPIAWCMWVFALLGASPMDALDDRFPGTGVITRAWRQFQRAARAHHAALLRGIHTAERQ